MKNFYTRWLSLIWLILLLNGCTGKEKLLGDIAYGNGGLYLCGNQVQHLNLSNNSIEEISIRCEKLLTTRQGQVWIITPPDQVRVFDGKTWIDSNIPHEGYIEYLVETSDGSVWFSSSLLSYYDSDTGKASIVVPAIPVSSATPAPKTDEWIITHPGSGRIGSVFEASDGTIWYNQQSEGLVRWNRATGQKRLWTPDESFQGFIPIPAKFIQTHDGDVWVGTDTGVYRLRNDVWQTWIFPEEDANGLRKKSMGDFRVMDLIEDDSGDVWAAFRRAGVAMWNGSEWKSVGDFESPAGPTTLFEDNKGRVWIGSRQHDVVSSKGGALKEYDGIRLTSFVEAPDHRLFGGGAEGLFLYDPESDQWNPYPDQ